MDISSSSRSSENNISELLETSGEFNLYLWENKTKFHFDLMKNSDKLCEVFLVKSL